MSDKSYDIILFGVTGFTGKLAVEYLLQKQVKSPSFTWAACARNQSKAQDVLQEIVDRCNVGEASTCVVPDLLIADLACPNPDDEEILRKVVQKTRVVLTCCGPFEKYGQTLVRVCAEERVHYADICGETDFFRKMIAQHDSLARERGAAIVVHCGNDCIPQDLTVYELNQYAKSNNARLSRVETFVQVAEEAAFSGGTAATAAYQLSKHRTKGENEFDPLLTDANGEKSPCQTKNISLKQKVNTEFGKAGPWIMGPVMVNCVRRSNALLQYSPQLEYGDSFIEHTGWSVWVNQLAFSAVLGAAVVVPFFGRFLPSAGEGPAREDMESGFLTLHTRATMISNTAKDQPAKETKLEATFHFNKDTGYLYTAALLVECGMLLLEKERSGEIGSGGVLTPASAFGADLLPRILRELDATWELKESSDTG